MATYAAPREPGGSRWRPWKLPLLYTAVVALLYPLFRSSDEPTSLVGWLLPFLFVSGPSIWSAYSGRIRGYSVREDGVRIERGGSATTWIGPYDICAVALLAGPLPPELLHRVKPGHFPEGRFLAGSLGFVISAATRRRDLVVLDTEKERYLLSPEPAEAFLQDVLANAPNARRTDVPGPAFPLPAGRQEMGLGVSLTLGAAFLVFFAVLAVGRVPRSFTVDPDVIAIHRLAAGDVELPFDEVLSIEPLAADALLEIFMVDGRRLPGGIAWGQFRSDALGEFRLFASRRGPAVLVTAKIGKVVLTPEDPAAFVARVRERLSRR